MVDDEVLRNLALYYLPAYLGPNVLAILCLFAFNIDRARHERNLRPLDETARGQAGDEAAPHPIILPGILYQRRHCQEVLFELHLGRE